MILGIVAPQVLLDARRRVLAVKSVASST